MIHNYDRSGFIGASDTNYVTANNWKTGRWADWWDVKLGRKESVFHGNAYTRAGNLWEHSILTAVDKSIDFDRQIIIDTTNRKRKKMLLRVNYDGNTDFNIYEVKSHKSSKQYEITEAHRQQCPVEMFAWNYAHEHEIPDADGNEVKALNKLWILSYALTPDEVFDTDWIDEDEAYAGKLPVDPSRIIPHPVKYDKAFIQSIYTPKLIELTKALIANKYPY